MNYEIVLLRVYESLIGKKSYFFNISTDLISIGSKDLCVESVEF